MDLVPICAPPDFEINNSLRIFDKLLKNHTANENTLTEMKNSLDNILKRVANDEKETRNDEFQPILKKFKPNPENMEENGQMESQSNIRSSNKTVSTSTSGTSSSVASADAVLTPLMGVITPLMPFSHNYQITIKNIGSKCAPPDFEINNSLRIFYKLLKNHTANVNTLTEMKNSLDNILKRMANDEKETRNHEFQPSVKKFKPNPEDMEGNDLIESQSNIRASNRTVSTTHNWGFQQRHCHNPPYGSYDSPYAMFTQLLNDHKKIMVQYYNSTLKT